MKKRIFIISGFSGAGKGSIVRKLMEIENSVFKGKSKVWLSISDTTRERRNVVGDNYNFISISEFRERVNAGDYYLEHNLYNGNGYGTPVKPVLNALENGGTVLLEIDKNGAQQIRESTLLRDVEIGTIFICANAKTLYTRLKERGEDEKTISERLVIAQDELQNLNQYDFVFVNDDLDRTALRVWALISGAPVPVDYFDEELFYEE